MDFYYIVTDNGFLKTYYSEVKSLDGTSNNTVSFSATLRKARIFKTIEDAKNIIIDNKFVKCVIINQNGDLQSS